MNRLWAPWRIKYIQNKKQKKCIFCQAGKEGVDYVVFRSKYSICMLNIYPYNNGHLMIAPRAHIKDFSQLNDAQILDLIKALNKAKALLNKTIKPQGFNIGVNMSGAAGAGITGHLHVHIVPRWKGDSNFMPIVFQTKVISQSLKELHKLLIDAKSGND